MMKDGTYAAWFKTPAGQGTGIAHLRDGVVTRGDDILTYSGSYATDGDDFVAIICTTRHSPGRPSLRGKGELSVFIHH
jgi:hypothetical protein